MIYQELDKTAIDKNIYLIKGDAFLCDKCVKQITSKLKLNQLAISEFNDEFFDAIGVINACNQFSFFDEKRMVVVKNISKELNEKEKELFLSYENNVNKNCVLLLIDYIGSNAFDFIKTASVIDCKPSELYIKNVIKDTFVEKGKSIDSNAVDKLAENCLGDISKVELEIKKICDFLGEEKHISIETINKLVSQSVEIKVFDLTNALSVKNIVKAQSCLYDMLQSGEVPIKILGLISNCFRRLFFAKISKESDAELSKIFGVKEFAIKKAREQAKNFTAKQLKDIDSLILETDYNIKSGKMTQENALYFLIFSIYNI